MKPAKTLTEAEYQSLVWDLVKAPSWGDFLNGCEAEFLEVNRDFYPLLLQAIQGAKMPFYRDLNALLIANPGMKKDDISFPDLDRLKALEGFIRQRLEEPKLPQAQGKDAPPAEDLTFEGLFLKPEDAARTIAAMKKLGIVNDGEVYTMGPKRKAALIAVWDVLKRKNLVHLIPDAQAAELLAVRFKTTIAPRTAGNRPAYYNELFRELMTLL